MVTEKRNLLSKIVQTLLMLEWMILLSDSDAFYGTYLLCGMLSAASLFAEFSYKQEERWWKRRVIDGLALFLSFAVALANYSMMQSAVSWIGMLCGGYVIGKNLLGAAYGLFLQRETAENAEERNRTALVFWLTLLAGSAINLVYLFLFNYPGTLTPDSLSQIAQILEGEYTNHHPYWHTMLIRVPVRLGMRIFGDINAGIAMYSVMQIILMAACFAYAVMTLYQAGIQRKLLILVASAYLFLPYNIIYASTMWKDVLFGGAVLVMIVSLYRIFKCIGRSGFNYTLLFVGLMGTALLRNNGWLALLATAVILAGGVLRSRRKYCGIILMFSAVLLTTWVMKNPVLDNLNIQESNFRESLSIPIQQIARVVALDCELADEQTAMLSRVVDLEKVPEWYAPHISDPVKFEVDGTYIKEHKAEFFKTWLEIGMRYPGVYLHAWIEQTKGYWNGGYNYWVWSTGVYENEWGISSVRKRNEYPSFGEMDLPRMLEPLFSIGLHVWIILALFVFHLLWGDREMAFLAVPVLMTVGTLLVATPVFSEFRYAYAVFTVTPVYMAISMVSRSRES